MAIDNSSKYTTEATDKVRPRAGYDTSPTRKTRISHKIFSITMLGASVIIILDSLKHTDSNPAWAITCLLIGIPVSICGLYELIRK